MSRSIAAAALAMALLTLVGGCPERSPVVSLRRPTKRMSSDDYDSVLGRWTRQQKVIKELDTTLRVHATCFAPEFTAVYLARQTQVYQLSPDKRAELTRELEQSWSRSYRFLVAVATQDFAYNDLDRKHSVWNVTLANDNGQVVPPAEIRTEQNSPRVSAFFPFVGRFHRAYVVSFPKALPDGSPLISAGTERMILKLAGPLGRAELEWRLR